MLLSGIEPQTAKPRSLVSIPTMQGPILRLYCHNTAMAHNVLWAVVYTYVSPFL